MPRWVGLLGSWALLVLALGVLGYAVAAESITLADARKLQRYQAIDDAIEGEVKRQVGQLQDAMSKRSTQVTTLQSEVVSAEKQIEDLHDSAFVITVSTTENKVYARRDGQLVFEAVCSTGKGTALRTGNRTTIFRTPIGRFRIQSKEEHPMWVPPDWHFIEQARENGLSVVHLNRGQSLGDLSINGNEVVSNGYPLPQGELIVRGGAIVVPPVGTRQRQFPDVLGDYRLNLGDGYALHGTQAVSQLGRSVSHGCVRLSNENIAQLYAMANVGDEVVIY
ncbi:MAG TPA: L,D-transpeptidase [Thermoanaerobaculia bacterium]|nr:L,D-transpeptidase [Thermoanaerobaculia bacterium]